MLWEVELLTDEAHDVESPRIAAKYALLGGPPPPDDRLVGLSSRGYLLEGALSLDDAGRLADELLRDALVEDWVCNPVPAPADARPGAVEWTVLLKPGVMDPVAETVRDAARDL